MVTLLSDDRCCINGEVREKWRGQYIYEWEVVIICDSSNNEFIYRSFEFYDHFIVLF